jgi:hypothetical protein
MRNVDQERLMAMSLLVLLASLAVLIRTFA